MKSTIAALAAALLAAPAMAQTDDDLVIDDDQGDNETNVIVEQPEPSPRLIIVDDDDDEGPGISVSAGGGIFSFSDNDARNLTTEVGPTYGARVHLGSRMPVSVELGYIGSAQELNALGVQGDALLISNGVDAALRLGMTGDEALRPYFVTGGTWKHYSVERTPVRTSSMRRQDDVFEIPVGGGVAYYFGGAVFDLRGQYRFAMDENLLRGPDDTDLDNWDLTVRVGMEM
jgi:hypothetical protein